MNALDMIRQARCGECQGVVHISRIGIGRVEGYVKHSAWCPLYPGMHSLFASAVAC